MSTAYVVVTILAAAWVGYSAASLLLRSKQIVKFLTDYGGEEPQCWKAKGPPSVTAGPPSCLVGCR